MGILNRNYLHPNLFYIHSMYSIHYTQAHTYIQRNHFVEQVVRHFCCLENSAYTYCVLHKNTAQRYPLSVTSISVMGSLMRLLKIQKIFFLMITTYKIYPTGKWGKNSGYLFGVCRYIWALSTIGLLTVGTAERAYMCTAFFQISFYKYLTAFLLKIEI